MNMPKDKSIDNAVVSATQEAIPDINVLATELANLLKRNIEAYVSPDHPKVKQALINQIAVIKYSESLDAPVSPLSLYEAQLYKRLGYVPTWLNALK